MWVNYIFSFIVMSGVISKNKIIRFIVFQKYE